MCSAGEVKMPCRGPLGARVEGEGKACLCEVSGDEVTDPILDNVVSK